MFVVEHLDPELEDWSALEYNTINQESHEAGCEFILSSVPPFLSTSDHLLDISTTSRNIEHYFAEQKSRICLLDPAAEQSLSPADGDDFQIFLFGGILGDDPPRDRTSELRKKGFVGRNAGPVQMTTDTCVRVTRMVVKDKLPLDQIPYIDFPEIKTGEKESVEMPFRYVRATDGSPIIPVGMVELIKADAEKGFDKLDFVDEAEGMERLGVT